MISKQAARLIALVLLAMPHHLALAAGDDNTSGIRAVSPTNAAIPVAGTNPVSRVRGDQLPISPVGSLTRKLVHSQTNLLVRIEGTVLDQGLGEYVILRDETGTIRVETRQTTPLGGGERATAWGRLSWDGTHVFLRSASVQPLAWGSIGERRIVPAPGKPEPLPTLTQVCQIRDLPPAKCVWKYPVQVRGVITALWKDAQALFVQDDTAGIYVSAPDLKPDSNLEIGDVVELDGVTAPGGYAPIIELGAVKVVGRGKLPAPRLVTLYQMAMGQFDGQWIEVRGVVRSAQVNRRFTDLQLSDLNGLVQVEVPGGDAFTNLLDSLVRIRGVCGSSANSARQLTGAYVWSPSTNLLVVEEQGVADPFTLPAQPIVSLSEYTQWRAIQHRVKIAGVVTFSQPGRPLFVQDETGGAPVYLAEAADFKPGDRVEVAGYLTPSHDFGYEFRNASCRVIGRSAIPVPKSIPAVDALNQSLHGIWVTVDARLVGSSRRENEDVMTLQAGNLLLEALRPNRGNRAEDFIPPAGSLLRLRGVYSILGDESRMPRALRLYVPSTEPIQVMEQASWWDAQHTVAALGTMSLILLAAAFWGITLRRRVREQTLIIRERLEKEAALQQSYREIFNSANDLIFTLDSEGRLTSLNPAGQRALGYQAEEVNQLTADLILAPSTRGIDRRLLEMKPSSGNVATSDCEFVTKDGRRLLVETSLRVTWKDGRPQSIQGIGRDITERKRAEEALQQSEQKFRSLVEQSLVGVYVIQHGRFAYVNPRLAEIFGYTSEEMIRECTVEDAVAEEDRPLVQSQIHQRITGESGTVHYNFRGRRKDDSLVYVEVLGNRADYCGQPAVLGTLLDITERRQAEAALAEASSLLETLLENSPDCIYFKDAQSRFVRFSKAFEKLFNVADAESLRGKTDFDFFKEEHARPAFEDEQEIIRSGKPIIGKLEKESHPDGRVTWALTTKMPWRDRKGNIIGTFGISKDVTAIKETEEKLAQERELFKTLLDNIPDFIYFKDRESRFVRVSKSKARTTLPAAQNLHLEKNPSGDSTNLPAHFADSEAFAGYLIGKTDFDTYEEKFARAAFEEEQAILRTGNPLIGKLEQATNFDGSVIWKYVTKMPWRDKEGNIIGTFGVSRDVTAIKKAEAELEAAHKRLIETSRLAGMAEVATDVLHNVGNVLNSVNVSCSLTIDRVKTSKVSSVSKVSSLLMENRDRLAEFLTSDPRGRQIPEFLAALSEHLTSEQTAALKELELLVKHIDHIKQIVAMQQSYAKVAGVLEIISPTQMVDDALHINAAALLRHEVQVRRDFEETPQIMTEKHKVLQILVNLIRNAKYAMDDGKRPNKLLTIKIANDVEGRVKIQVIDNGVGIPQENLTRIFSHGFTTRRNGHGFGLHSSALAVRDLGGSLEVHSDGPAKGAVFTLTLPHAPPTKSQKPL